MKNVRIQDLTPLTRRCSGFKMGPALGEMVADLVLKDGTPEPVFRLATLSDRRRDGA